MQPNLIKYLSNIPLQSSLSRELWQKTGMRTLEALKSASSSMAIKTDFGPILGTSINARLPLGVFQANKGAQSSTLGANHLESSYLPIETFRNSDATYFQGNHKERTFLSSGTLSHHRGRSHFSNDGLLLYKAQSLLMFYDVLRALLPDHDPQSLEGICLIPPTDQWPDSSLAQMMAWIAEFWPITYSTPAQLTGLLNSSKGKPIWLFGTALHWYQFIEQSRNTAEPCSLPAHSLVFETGGTKGQARELPRDEYIHALKKSLSITSPQIISEYGMSELACQAYDYADLSSGRRRFRFPPWVQPYVTQGLDQFHRQGTGALGVVDPLRIDYPWPLRIQDIVTLDEDGSFTLQGRIQTAPLKGCSLLVDDVVTQNTDKFTKPHLAAPPKPQWSCDLTAVESRISAIVHLLGSIPTSLSAKQLLAQEMGSENAAQSALSDLCARFPDNSKQWRTGTQTALGANAVDAQPKCYRTWILIAPSSHSLACIEPLVFGYLAGLKIYLRIPTSPSTKGFLLWFAQSLQQLPGANISFLWQDFRIGDCALPTDAEAILAFGDTDTINSLRQKSQLPTVGFGNLITAAFFNKGNENTATSQRLSERCLSEQRKLVKDAFSLGQKGCLSARIAFFSCSEIECNDKVAQWALQQALIEAASSFWQAELSLQQRMAVDQEYRRFSELGFLIAPRTNVNHAFFPCISVGDAEKILNLSRLNNSIEQNPLLASCAFVLPVLTFDPQNKRNIASLARCMHWMPELGRISFSMTDTKPSSTVDLTGNIDQFIKNSTKSRNHPVTLCNLGESNICLWDGLHQRQPYFALETAGDGC